jgi:uncharacterized protein (TIGR02687 family)
MDTQRITDALHQRFHQDGHRLVFWHDPEREFEESLPILMRTLDGVSLLRLDAHPALEVKVRLELEDPDGRYLLYAPAPPPAPEDDWLLDIRLYSGGFSADRASMLLADLKLTQVSLRAHLAERARFFASRERLERARRLIQPEDDALAIDRKLIAVVARAEQPEFFHLLIALCAEMLHPLGELLAASAAGAGADLDAEPPAWEELAKFGLLDAFWTLVEQHFGWREETPRLKNLLLRLLVSDFAHGCGGAVPTGLKHLLLPRTGTANAVVCLAQWRDSSARGAAYERLSGAVAESLKLEQHLSGLRIEDLAEVKTFLLVEQVIASRLRDRVLETANSLEPAAIRALAAKRQDGYWATLALPDRPAAPRRALHAVYQALQVAAELFDRVNRERGRLAGLDAAALFRAYRERLFRIDQAYRHGCEAADTAEARGWDILKALRERVEQAYTTGFVSELALAWNRALEQGLLARWQLAEVGNQQQFFAREVAPILAKGSDRRVFVIISDAFRFEAAQELTEQLNGRYRIDARLDAQLGVLPSYTALGMAALLPHQRLDYDASDLPRLDGQPCASLEQRARVLAGVGGVAIKADDFMALKKDSGRAFIKPYRVIYIYHDRIDAIGDKAVTEAGTFAAVRLAIDEIADLTAKIINSLNGNHVLITADHGFLFQESALAETDCNRLREKPANTLIAKKRYLLGRGLPDSDQAFHGSTAITAGAAVGEGANGGAMEFWVPLGANRFHFVGGARFVHGGAMPQEITIPLIRVQHLRDEKAARSKIRSVGVSVLGNHFKVTTNRYRVQLMQTEPVGERVKPITMKLAIYEGDDPVTNVETLTFDSPSADMNHWKKSVSLTLQGRPFERKQVYHLILREAETGVEEARFDVVIDLAFENDF